MPEVTDLSLFSASYQGPPPRPRPLPNPQLCYTEISTGVRSIDEAKVRNSKEEVDTFLVVVSAYFDCSREVYELTANPRPDCSPLSKVHLSLSHTNSFRAILQTSPFNSYFISHNNSTTQPFQPPPNLCLSPLPILLFALICSGSPDSSSVL